MSQSGHLRILVLEDEAHLAADLQKKLEWMSHEVIGPVASCESALELIWSQGVDAAILDMVLGETTCEVVADGLSLSGIPWAFASNIDRHELQDRFPEAPVIAKPPADDQVADVIGGLLGKQSD